MTAPYNTTISQTVSSIHQFINTGKRKLNQIREREREIKEEDLMKSEDLYVMFCLYRNKAATDGQRVFRGWLVRIFIALYPSFSEDKTR